MKINQFGTIILLCLAVGTLISCQQPTTGTFTDDIGREITLDGIPQRIVSHVPAITETLYALELDDKIVGVSDFCDYPAEAQEKHSVGDYFNPSIEDIIAQDPDLVLTDGYSKDLIPQLENLEITTIVLNPKEIVGILEGIKLLGDIFGVEERAAELVEEMNDSIDEVVSRVAGSPRIRIFYVFDATDLNSPWTAGPGSFAHSLITIAGGDNVAADTQGAWVQFGMEALLHADPEVILVDAGMGTAVVSLKELEVHPAWGETTAVKQGRIHLVDGDLVNRPGPA